MASTASFSSCPQAQTYSSTWPKPSKLSLQPPLLQAITVFLHSFPPQPQAPFRPRSLPPCLRLRPRQFRRKFDEFTVTHQRISPDYASGFTAADFYPRPAVDCRAVSEGMYKMANQELKLESKEIDRRKYNLFLWRQIKAETEAWERMVEEYKDLERVMREKKLAPNLPYVKALFLGWFEPLREAIAREQQVQQTKKHKAAFAPNIDLLPPDKMALIVMHKMMGLGMVGNQHGCVQVVQGAVHIGMAIEQEVRIHSFLEKNQKLPEKEDYCC